MELIFDCTFFGLEFDRCIIMIVLILTSMFAIWSLSWNAAAETQVELTTPITPVRMGDILVIQCQIWNLQNGAIVIIGHSLNGGSESITTGSSIVDSSVKNRVYLAIRSYPDGSDVYFITMLDASQSDQGEYTCTILSGIRVLTHDTINIQIYTFPDKTQPTCTGGPSDLIMTEGSILQLTCNTYRTTPLVDLRWLLIPSYQYLQSVNASHGENVISNLNIKITKEHNGATFKCELTSRGFPDRMQFCKIGPISVMESGDNTIPGSSLISVIPERPVITPETENRFLTENCDKTCQSPSSTVFILTISTLATCMLTVVFLITTIVMCCKYYNISSEVNRETGQQYISSRASDPVYVSLQRRREQEQVYMTLEDPNNPEGKVLLPKEVFDQFYNRTLSLRKT